MPRPQFTLRALLVAMLVVGAFLGGMALQRQIDRRPIVLRVRQDVKYEDLVKRMTALSKAGVNVEVAPADQTQWAPIVTMPPGTQAPD